MAKWLLQYNRLPWPPVQSNILGPNMIPNQMLEITVLAEDEEAAIAEGQRIINHQISGRTGPHSAINVPRVIGGSPVLYTLKSVTQLYGK
jgi:hypothetical protein